jgi:hypothetical protein
MAVQHDEVMATLEPDGEDLSELLFFSALKKISGGSFLQVKEEFSVAAAKGSKDAAYVVEVLRKNPDAWSFGTAFQDEGNHPIGAYIQSKFKYPNQAERLQSAKLGFIPAQREIVMSEDVNQEGYEFCKANLKGDPKVRTGAGLSWFVLIF